MNEFKRAKILISIILFLIAIFDVTLYTYIFHNQFTGYLRHDI